MNTLSESFLLCSFGEDRRILGIEKHTDDDKIILTHRTRSIVVYDVEHRKSVKEWSVKTGQWPLCPVVMDQTTGQYVVALNDGSIRIWEEDDLAIDKGTRIKTEGRVHRLFSCQSQRPLVVYEDGTFSQLGDPGELQGKDIEREKGNRIIWCDAHKENDVIYLVIVLNKELDPSSLVICVYRLDSKVDDCEITEWHLQDKMNKEQPVSFSIVWIDEHIHLLTLWPDGTLLRSEMSRTEEVTGLPRLDRYAAIIAVDPTQIAIYGVLSNDDQVGIGMWDSKFNIVENFCPLLDCGACPRQFFCKHGRLFTVCGHSLYYSTFQAVPTTLAAAFGKHRHPAQLNVTNDTEESLLSLRNQLDASSTAEDFSEAFARLHEALVADPHVVLWSSPHITELVMGCISRKHFWPHSELQQLVESGNVSGSLCTRIVTEAVQRVDLDLVLSCLAHVPDIPESTLVVILKFFISERTPRLSSVVGNEVAKITSVKSRPLSAGQTKRINTLLTYSCNEIYLQEHLKNLDFSDVLQLMRFFLHQLKTVPTQTSQVSTRCAVKPAKNQPIETPAPTPTPTILQLVDWLGALLDAHFAQIVLSADSRSVLVDLHQIVEDQVQFYDEMGSLEGILALLKIGGPLPQKQNINQYCIQSLHVY